VACLLVAALTPRPVAAEEAPIPRFALRQWESQMITYGRKHCAEITKHTGDALSVTYYDMTRVMYQIADYTKDPSWNACALAARRVYRDEYVMVHRGGVPGYWNFTTGLRMDYDRTHDPLSKEAVGLLSTQAAYAREGGPLEWTQSADKSREVAYAIVSYVDAEALGFPRRARRAQLVDQAYDHLKQWFVTFAWKGPSPALHQFSPFMVGLTAHALIRDWEQTRDPRLGQALRTAADWLWEHAWQGRERSMFYDALNGGTGVGTGHADLNLLIAPLYAFLYRQTGEAKYRTAGDELFGGGVDGAWIEGPKQFNQNYWWSFDYVRWRSPRAVP
jgi:hypothetical protein